MTDKELLEALKERNKKFRNSFLKKPVVLKMMDDAEQNNELSWWNTSDPIAMLYYETINQNSDSPIKKSAYYLVRSRYAEENKGGFFTNKEYNLLNDISTSKSELNRPVLKLAAAYCMDTLSNLDERKLDFMHNNINKEYLNKCMNQILRRNLENVIINDRAKEEEK